MKVFSLAALVLVIGLTVAPATFAQSGSGVRTSPLPPPPPKPSASADRLTDLGKAAGSNYTNEHFGVSLAAPKGWTILDVEQMKAMEVKAKEVFQNEGDATVKRALEEAVGRTVPLFGASKLPPGTTGSFNATVVCVAERVPTALVKTPRDYYVTLLHSMKLSQELDVEVVEPLQTKRIGVTDFASYTLKITSNFGIALQRHLISIKSPYVFAIVLTYTEESDAKAFDEVVSSIKTK